MPDHCHVVCYGTECTAIDILEAIEDAYQKSDVSEAIKHAKERVSSSATNFNNELRAVIQLVEQNHQPMLLILDDFEQVLQPDPPEEGLHLVRSNYVESIGRLLKAFNNWGGESRLLMTCRYEFQLNESWLAETNTLEKIQLFPFTNLDHQRQAVQLQKHQDLELDQVQRTWISQAIGLAGGNPGLLSHMIELIATDLNAGIRFVCRFSDYLKKGNDPKDSQVSDYLENLAVDAKFSALNRIEQKLLQAATLVDLPIPQSCLVAIGNQLETDSGEFACRRLLSFGLLDLVPDLTTTKRKAVTLNTLASPKVTPLDESEIREFAEMYLPLLEKAWVLESCPPECDVVICQLAEVAGQPESFVARAESALDYLDYQSRHTTGYSLAKSAISHFDNLTPTLSRACANLIYQAAADRADLNLASQLFEDAIESLSIESPTTEQKTQLGSTILAHSRLLIQTGELNRSLDRLQTLTDLFASLGDQRSKAVTLGEIARIKRNRGEVDQALKLHEEEIEVYEALGDQRSRALTLGDIARIKRDQGEIDQALKLNEEEIEVYEALGDQRSRAVTMGDIARIKRDRGEVEEALKLHEEEIEVYEALGDQRSRALTLGDIARIKRDRGEVDQALKLHEEEIEVYEALGDQRSRAVTMGDIARIKRDRGEVDQALKLHEERLKVFEALGNQRSRALTLGDIARIKQDRGEVEEALELHEEEIEVYEALGDQRSRAVTMGNIARIKRDRGEVDQALKLHKERLKVFEALGNQRSRALTLGDIARIKQDRGEVDEALKLHEEKLQITRNLDDADGIASTQNDRFDILIHLERHKEAIEAISESFTKLLEFRRVDGLAVVGLKYGQVLLAARLKTKAIEVLEISKQCWLKLKNEDHAKQVDQLIAMASKLDDES